MTLLWLILAGACAVTGCEPDSPRVRPATSDVLVASGRMADGRLLRLRVIRDDGGACLLLIGVDADVRGCARIPRERVPPIRDAVVAQATVVRRNTDHLEIHAVTSAHVARVEMRSGDPALGVKRSLLLRARDGPWLTEAGIDSGPFGYFFAEIPRAGESIRVVAFDARGRRVGGAGFGHLSEMGERFVLG